MQVTVLKGWACLFSPFFLLLNPSTPTLAPPLKKKGDSSVVEGAGRRRHWGDEWCCEKLNKIILQNERMGTANEQVSQHVIIESCVLMARRICVRFSARYLYFNWTNKNPAMFIPWSKFFATWPFFFSVYYTLFHITTCLSNVCHKCRLKMLPVYPIMKI